MSLPERFAVACFVAALHAEPDITAHYAAGLTDPTLRAAVLAESTAARATGPYGDFPPGKLSAEDVAGPLYRTRAADLGARLAAALAQAHRLVLHPRDAVTADMQALLAAGWSTSGIVTLSQLVAFLCFQIRAIVGLRTLRMAT